MPSRESTDDNSQNGAKKSLSPSSRSQLRPPRTFRINQSIPEHTQTIDNYQLGKTIGKGNFAKVKLAIHNVTGAEVAIKIIGKESLNEASLAKLDREVNIMKRLDHPNIVRLYEVIDTEDTLFLVMEYAAGGEIFDFLVEHGRMKEKVAREKFRQIVSAIEYCHGLGIIHRDLKAENLLLDADMNVKIADFGFSTFYEAGKPLDTFCGSPPYAAPELFQGKKYEGPEVDVWSLGVILYTLVSGSLPFDGSNLKELRERVLRGKYRIPFYMSTECEQLLKKFLVLVPSRRISLRNSLGNEWMNIDMQVMPPHTTPDDVEYDEELLAQLDRLGFDREYVLDALRQGSYDHRCATYALLKRNGGQVAPQFRESSLVDERPVLRQQSLTLQRSSTTVAPLPTLSDPSSFSAKSESAPSTPQTRPLSLNVPGNKTPNRLLDRRASDGGALVPLKPMKSDTTPTTTSSRSLRQRSVTDGDSSESFRSPERRNIDGGPAEIKGRSSFSRSMRRRFSRSNVITDTSPIKIGNAQPRVLRFTFSRTNTSMKPPKELLIQLKKVLGENNIQFQQQEPFLLVCMHGQIHFEIEVCKLPRLAMHGIKHKRLSGQSLGYKNICTQILNGMDL